VIERAALHIKKYKGKIEEGKNVGAKTTKRWE